MVAGTPAESSVKKRYTSRDQNGKMTRRYGWKLRLLLEPRRARVNGMANVSGQGLAPSLPRRVSTFD